jgi:hypothetical protein
LPKLDAILKRYMDNTLPEVWLLTNHRQMRAYRTLTTIVMLGGMVAGCATGGSGMAQQYVGMNSKGQEVLTGTCLPEQSAAECQALRPVTVTNKPADEEFWQFEARIKVRALVGIPYGRMPQDFNVIGKRDRCEAVRAIVTQAGTPTEECKGPFYFRRN